uniref:ADP-ribosylation factor-like protein 14 n=1 Tax=Ciona savignyi TaxID=51511 RepID=H2YN57_CIOSA
MGLYVSRLSKMWSDFNSQPASAVMLGLDGAGKTTVTYKLKLDEVVTTIPTLGFNVETVSPCKGLTLTIWDVGGQDIIRKLWRHYFTNTEGLIYVVDSSDKQRFAESREELHKVLEDDEMRGKPVLVLANKQDLPCSAAVSNVAEALGLRKLSADHKWHIQACCAVRGDGIFEGFEVFSTLVKEFKKSRHNFNYPY